MPPERSHTNAAPLKQPEHIQPFRCRRHAASGSAPGQPSRGPVPQPRHPNGLEHPPVLGSPAARRPRNLPACSSCSIAGRSRWSAGSSSTSRLTSRACSSGTAARVRSPGDSDRAGPVACLRRPRPSPRPPHRRPGPADVDRGTAPVPDRSRRTRPPEQSPAAPSCRASSPTATAAAAVAARDPNKNRPRAVWPKASKAPSHASKTMRSPSLSRIAGRA
jgi:hypothetical protein